MIRLFKKRRRGKGGKRVSESKEDVCRNILPLVEWIKIVKVGEEICRVCVLPLLVGWYRSELEETGNGDYGKKLSELVDKEDVVPEEVASELDNIKKDVKDEKLRSRLKEFDCAVQKNAR